MKTKDVLPAMLERLLVGKPVSRGALHLFPLAGGGDAQRDLVLLEEALEHGTLRVEELDGGGSVPELRVVNGGAKPVLILEGDELVGAKQNRVVNSSVLVAASSDLVLPVSCVERGRWSRHPRVFSGGDGSPHLGLRRVKSRSVHDSLKRGRGHRSDQGAVWEEVDRVGELHGAASPTDALQATRASLLERLAEYETLADELPKEACGVVVALGNRPALVEVLAGPRFFAEVLRKLLSGYAFEALEHRDAAAPDTSTVEVFIRSVAAARHEEHPAVGEGTDVRFGTEGLSGYALVWDGRVVHAAAFAG